MSVFVNAQGIKTVHAGGGDGKILSTQLLNAPILDMKVCMIMRDYAVTLQ